MAITKGKIPIRSKGLFFVSHQIMVPNKAMFARTIIIISLFVNEKPCPSLNGSIKSKASATANETNFSIKKSCLYFSFLLSYS